MLLWATMKSYAHRKNLTRSCRRRILCDASIAFSFSPTRCIPIRVYPPVTSESPRCRRRTILLPHHHPPCAATAEALGWPSPPCQRPTAASWRSGSCSSPPPPKSCPEIAPISLSSSPRSASAHHSPRRSASGACGARHGRSPAFFWRRQAWDSDGALTPIGLRCLHGLKDRQPRRATQGRWHPLQKSTSGKQGLQDGRVGSVSDYCVHRRCGGAFP